MNTTRIGFIGGGNMTRSLVGGLIADGTPPDRLWVSEPEAERRSNLAASFGVHTCADNCALVNAADVVVLAVKPQVMRTICQEVAAAVQSRRPLVVSIAAGVELQALEHWLGTAIAIVRTMPNTPSLVQSGATALVANSVVNADQRELAERVMRAVGLTLWLKDEALMDAVTALSGSGPAYFFLLMELLQTAGTGLGLSAEQARLLTLQTAFGAAKMALESREDAATLRARVTSPGGTTERALEILREGEIGELFRRALEGARDRSRELASQLGEKA